MGRAFNRFGKVSSQDPLIIEPVKSQVTEGFPEMGSQLAALTRKPPVQMDPIPEDLHQPRCPGLYTKQSNKAARIQQIVSSCASFGAGSRNQVWL